MKIEIKRNANNGDWLLIVDDNVVTRQHSIVKLFYKGHKYFKGQE